MEKKAAIGKVEGIKNKEKRENNSMRASEDTIQSEKLRYKNADKIYE